MANIFGTLTNFLSGGNDAKAAAATQAGVDQLSALQTPDVTQMQLELEQLVQQGVITPEQAQAYTVDPSAMNGISTDPALRQAQMDALSGLQDISASGGLTAADRANLSRIQTDEDTKARGSREAILQNAQARGAGGSGLEMLMQMQNAQDAATRASQRDLDVAGMAQERALQALMQRGQLGGQIQAQDFGQKAEIAGANDAISKFNAQNKQQVGLANTAAKNTAQAANLENKQRIADTNAQLANQQQAANKALAQQDFENQYKKAGGIAGALGNQAQTFNQAGQSTKQLIGTGAQAAAVASDESLKKDVEDFDAGAFLDSLTSKKYRYKDPEKFGDGEFVGTMAQDLEKTPAGAQMVTDTPEGKMVDYNKAGGPLMASLSHLHERLKRLEGAS